MSIELVVEVVLCTLLGESQVGGEVVDAVGHRLLLLMQHSLCTKEVALGDIDIVVLELVQEELGLVYDSVLACRLALVSDCRIEDCEMHDGLDARLVEECSMSVYLSRRG